MGKCSKCDAYLIWSYEKGWYCPNGCVFTTYTSNYTEYQKKQDIQTTNTIKKDEHAGIDWAFYEMKSHQELETLSRAFICAKYNITLDWFRA